MKFVILTFILSIISLFTRLYKIHLPLHVCWDEFHFTRMINSYLNNIFFLDVHPPLGKLLLSIASSYFGYTGNFSFIHVGITYAEYFPYIQLRMFVGLFSSLIPIICYLITFKLSSNHQAAFLSYILVLSDTAFLTMGRLILLDSFLHVLMLIAFYFSLSYLTEKTLSFKWYLYVFLTGVFMSLAISVKFVGLFLILLIYLMTLSDIWCQFTDNEFKLKYLLKQLCFYFFGLLCLPIIIYLSIFFVHFKLLYKSGSSDSFFSTQFQASLLGNPNNKSTAYVLRNDYISLRISDSLYLYSDPKSYPIGDDDELTQVLIVFHRSVNNKWLIFNSNAYSNYNDNVEELDIISAAVRHQKIQENCVRNGDTVFLQHAYTKAFLHVTNYSSISSSARFLVSSSYELNNKTEKSLFQIKYPIESNDCLTTLKHKFYLYNEMFDCQIYVEIPSTLSSNEYLEVSCSQHRDEKQFWVVEQIFSLNDTIRYATEDTSFNNEISFLEKLFEYHMLMIKENNNLKLKKDDISSEPWQWPINFQAHAVSGPYFLIFIIGNPFTWLLCLINIFSYTIYLNYIYCNGFKIKEFISIRKYNNTINCISSNSNKKEQYQSEYTTSKNLKIGNNNISFNRNLNSNLISAFVNSSIKEASIIKKYEKNLIVCNILWIAWFFHYLPFWFMKRVVFLHHYLSAQLFAIMMTSFCVTHASQWASHKLSSNLLDKIICSIICILCFISFVYFCPLSYGIDATSDDGFEYSQILLKFATFNSE